VIITKKLFNGTRTVGRGMLVDNEWYTVHRCGECGVTWAMPDWFLDERKEDHVDWYCPNGHCFVFSGESEKEKLKRQLKQAKDSLARTTARADQTEASLRATKGVVTKQRRKLEKVVAGVCPVDGCKRHFRDLRRHMSTKHPDYDGQPQG
jgi:hypothetical protein